MGHTVRRPAEIDPDMSGTRGVRAVVESKWQSEGRGARVRRSIGRPELKNLDPFLMLDEFEGSQKEGAGFPDHPHRGFETVSYLLEGEFTHEDFLGHRGVLKAGDLQWMTAGRGIVHSEMPGWEKTRGLQLWVNLPREKKMMAPTYQELSADQVPEASNGKGVVVRVVAGVALGVSSPVRTITPTYYLDFRVKPGAEHIQEIPEGWTVFVYTLQVLNILASMMRISSSTISNSGPFLIAQGEFQFGDQRVSAHHTVLFQETGGGVGMINVGQTDGHLVLIAGKPIGEPVVQRGPFVMCTQADLDQAFNDFRRGKNGFEGAVGWRSVEGNK